MLELAGSSEIVIMLTNHEKSFECDMGGGAAERSQIFGCVSFKNASG